MSTIFANKIKNNAGGNNVKINQLSGIDTAGSITVQGEGGATTNLQQGLVKFWASGQTNNPTTIEDSFNMSSFTDNGTGDTGIVFTNNMATVDYYQSHQSNQYHSLVTSGNQATTGFTYSSRNSSNSLVDCGYSGAMATGDLA